MSERRLVKLAVTGSRHWSDERLLRAVLDSFADRQRVSVLIHGGARGADFMAESWAIDRDVQTMVYLPDYQAHGKAAPLVRNDEIVNAASDVIAFRAYGSSNGTDYTVTSAINAGKLRLIISDRRTSDSSSDTSAGREE